MSFHIFSSIFLTGWHFVDIIYLKGEERHLLLFYYQKQMSSFIIMCLEIHIEPLLNNYIKIILVGSYHFVQYRKYPVKLISTPNSRAKSAIILLSFLVDQPPPNMLSIVLNPAVTDAS
jgi:hypothetical protein